MALMKQRMDAKRTLAQVSIEDRIRAIKEHNFSFKMACPVENPCAGMRNERAVEIYMDDCRPEVKEFYVNEVINSLTKQLDIAIKEIETMGAYAGHIDPVAGCRNISKRSVQALREIEAIEKGSEMRCYKCGEYIESTAGCSCEFDVPPSVSTGVDYQQQKINDLTEQLKIMRSELNEAAASTNNHIAMWASSVLEKLKGGSEMDNVRKLTKDELYGLEYIRKLQQKNQLPPKAK